MTQLTDRPGAAETAATPPADRSADARRWVSPAIGWREVALAALGGALLSIVMNWPIPVRLGSHIPEDLGDPVRTAWQLAWQGHALLHHPTHLYQANAFWPLQNSFAFSDSLLGYAPASLVGTGLKAALVRYNLLFLFAYALAFVGAYLLARELGVRRLAAIVAGAAFAYAPFRLTMNGHLHVISSGGIPLSLFFLVRGYRRANVPLVVAGWLVAAWQLSLGFTTGLQLAYLLAVLFAIAAVVWLRRGRPALARRLVVATLAGLVVFAGVGYVQARPLLKVHRDYSTAQRRDKDITNFSAPPKAFLSAPPEDRVWGHVTKPIRDSLRTPNEQNQFPGVTIFVLALAGLLAGAALPRRLRIGLGLGILVLAYMSLGYGVPGGTHIYRFWFNHAPGWNGIRTPGRLETLTSLGLALLAAAGAQAALGLVGRRSARLPRWALVGAPAAVAVVLLAGVLVEGRGSMPNPRVPDAPAAVLADKGPELDLPANPAFNRVYQFWSADHFQPLVNGVATFRIDSLVNLQNQVEAFPDRNSVEKLRRAGVRTVILHLDISKQPIPRKWRNPQPHFPSKAAAKSIRGLPVTRQRFGNVIVYHLKPVAHPLNSLSIFNG